jgi:hypothetical protein
LNRAEEMKASTNGATDAQPTSSHSGPELLLAGEGDASSVLAGRIGGSGHQGDGMLGEGKGEGEGSKGESEGEGADDLGGRSWTWALLRGGSSVCMAPAACVACVCIDKGRRAGAQILFDRAGRGFVAVEFDGVCAPTGTHKLEITAHRNKTNSQTLLLTATQRLTRVHPCHPTPIHRCRANGIAFSSRSACRHAMEPP